MTRNKSGGMIKWNRVYPEFLYLVSIQFRTISSVYIYNKNIDKTMRLDTVDQITNIQRSHFLSQSARRLCFRLSVLSLFLIISSDTIIESHRRIDLVQLINPILNTVIESVGAIEGVHLPHYSLVL